MSAAFATHRTVDAAELVSNRWYEAAFQSAEPLGDTGLGVISPLCFLATKFVAYHDRGASDPATSHDLEDIVRVARARPELLDRISHDPGEVSQFLRLEFSRFTNTEQALELIQGHLHSDAASQAHARPLLARLRSMGPSP